LQFVNLIMIRIILLFVFIPFLCFSQEFPSSPANYVTDEANILSETEKTQLNTKLRSFEDSTSTQLFVYIAPSLNGKVMADYCQEIFHAWKIGQSKKNNGVLIGIFIQDHKFRIHTGYGMEGVLPDLLTKRIQDEQMRPYFKQNMYYDGINAGVDQLLYWSKNEFTANDLNSPSNDLDKLMFTILYSVSLALFISLSIVLYKKYLGQKSTKKVLWIIGIVALFIPFVGVLILLVLNFVAYKTGRIQTRYYGAGENSNSYGGTSWSSSDSSSSFDGGGGGDSGGGGSDSSW